MFILRKIFHPLWETRNGVEKSRRGLRKKILINALTEAYSHVKEDVRRNLRGLQPAEKSFASTDVKLNETPRNYYRGRKPGGLIPREGDTEGVEGVLFTILKPTIVTESWIKGRIPGQEVILISIDCARRRGKKA